MTADIKQGGFNITKLLIFKPVLVLDSSFEQKCRAGRCKVKGSDSYWDPSLSSCPSELMRNVIGSTHWALTEQKSSLFLSSGFFPPHSVPILSALLSSDGSYCEWRPIFVPGITQTHLHFAYSRQMTLIAPWYNLIKGFWNCVYFSLPIHLGKWHNWMWLSV